MLHYRFVKIDRTFNYNELAEFGSQTSLSANKGVNQRVTRFTPFITPVNLSVKKKATPKVMNLGCSLWYKRVHSLLYIWSHQNLPEVLLAKQDGIVVTAYSGNN